MFGGIAARLETRRQRKGLSDNMDAVKNSFLLRGYFKKQKKAEAKKKADLKKQENLNKKNALKNVKDSIGN